jgi:hypothetical protein
VLIGAGLSLGALATAGLLTVPGLRVRPMPELAPLAMLGLLPILGAAAAGWCFWRGDRGGFLVRVAVLACALCGGIAAWGPGVVDAYKAPRALAAALPADQLSRETRVAAYGYFKPSLVFYCGREVKPLATEEQARDFLRSPLPSYLVMPRRVWEALRDRDPGPHEVLAEHYDLYDREQIVLVAGRTALRRPVGQARGW